ncbi:serine hydrolase domain-containing protein [Brevibacterium sp. UCMA 11754]|uniref:serine hydrolase domain-containing protein n=1 Tax=Brevibacterium sp. UCMA 11754 TaxID=2749198 RepID=UPI001F3B28B8|nr:serine hydrolase domain-containing protein [Brevibacterium sp. UCMA 11754]MCF2570942.1 beta-lactamase family protein [Brevibacterium sp. UCMA 11754]
MAVPSPPAHADAGYTVDDYLAKVVDSGVPGIAVSVMRDNEVAQTSAAGEAEDDRPMTADTPLRIESLSKSFTAMAVMQLEEHDKIDLDKQVRTYLPEFTIDDPRGGGITVRQLLNQTSGMTDATAPNLYDGGITTLKQSVAHLKTATLAADPGAAFNYHNPNYHVLARMVEVISGEQFDYYLSQHVFKPLNMTSTKDTQQSTDRVPAMARGHSIVYGKAFDSDGSGYFSEGSGGVVSTANDMSKWLQMQSSGGRTPDGTRLVSQEAIDLMHTPGSKASNGYGFGWYNAESAEGPPVRISHSGAGAGFGAYQGIFTESGDSIVVMINSGTGITSPDPGVLAQNLLHDLNPEIPALQAFSNGVWTDLILTGLGLITVALAVVGLVRARRWGQRRAGRSKIWTILRLIPPLIPIAWVLALPSLQLLLTGRTAPYSLLFHVSPVALIWFFTWAIVCGALVAVRIVSYVRSERLDSTSTGPKGDDSSAPAESCR